MWSGISKLYSYASTDCHLASKQELALELIRRRFCLDGDHLGSFREVSQNHQSKWLISGKSSQSTSASMSLRDFLRIRFPQIDSDVRLGSSLSVQKWLPDGVLIVVSLSWVCFLHFDKAFGESILSGDGWILLSIFRCRFFVGVLQFSTLNYKFINFQK